MTNADFMTDAWDPMQPLATLDPESGEPPKTRMRSAMSVRQRVNEIRQAEETRSGRRSQVKGLLNGNPPVPRAKMRRLNREGDANINLRTGEATVDSAKTPYYDLVFDSGNDTCVQLKFDYETIPDSALNGEWSEICSEELDCTFKRWKGFDPQMQLKQWGMCVHGLGIPTFEDPTNWRWRNRTVGEVLVPDDALADIDYLEEAIVPRSIMPTKLFEKIKNPDAARKMGWNVDTVEQAIIRATPTYWRQQWGNEMERYQDALRCGDVMYNARCAQVFVVDYFVKEFDGKITHGIILDQDGRGANNPVKSIDGKGETNEVFLFEKQRRFNSFSEIFTPFFFDVTDEGLWHGVKGLGPKIYDFCSVENLLTCNVIDKANMGIAVVPKTALDKSSMETINARGVTFFQPGTSFEKVSFNDNIQASLVVKANLQAMREGNIGMYRQPSPTESSALPTLGQEQMASMERAMLTKGAINRYFQSLDRLWSEMVRRIFLFRDDESKEFRRRCVARGVPEELFKWEYVYEVKATRAMGYGSTAARLMASDKLMAGLPAITDERSRTNALRMAYSPIVGQDHIDSVFPRTKAAPTNDLSFAALENNALQSPTGSALVTSDQDHLGHFDIHTANVGEHVQALGNGQTDPMALLAHLNNYLPHAQTHLQALIGDKSREGAVQQRMQTLASIAKAKDQLQQQVTAHLAAQQQGQSAAMQISDDLKIGLAKVAADAHIKDAKLMRDAARKDWQVRFNARIKDRSTAGEERRKNLTTVNDARRANTAELAAA